MSNPGNSPAPLMTVRLVVALLLISALSFVAFFALSAYAPDLRSEENGGTNALSKSAVGFAGLHDLLREADVPVLISRKPIPHDRSVALHDIVGSGSGSQSSPPPLEPGLLVLTPDMASDAAEIALRARGQICLIILPKWITSSDRFHLGWVNKIGPMPPDLIAHLLQKLSGSTKLSQRDGWVTVSPAMSPDIGGIWTGKFPVEAPQSISGPDWVSDIALDRNGALLAHLRNSGIYVLADPDFANNHGIKDRRIAEGIYTLAQRMRGNAAVTFDVALNGFGTSPSLLRAAFAPPFLGATLCAILAALLLGFHAMVRFGTALRPEPVYAFGKSLLVDNSAGLIRTLGRDRGMAERYAGAMLGLVARFARGARDLPPETLKALERRKGFAVGYDGLLAEARKARTAQGLLRIANELYQWRVGITHEHR